MDRFSGTPLEGWAHVQQSIGVILTTPIGSRVMRRDFGSELPELIDRPQTSEVLLAIYAATAVAIEKWEPRFNLIGVEVGHPRPDGEVVLMLRGEYAGEVLDAEIPIHRIAGSRVAIDTAGSVSDDRQLMITASGIPAGWKVGLTTLSVDGESILREASGNGPWFVKIPSSYSDLEINWQVVATDGRDLYRALGTTIAPAEPLTTELQFNGEELTFDGDPLLFTPVIGA